MDRASDGFMSSKDPLRRRLLGRSDGESAMRLVALLVPRSWGSVVVHFVSVSVQKSLGKPKSKILSSLLLFVWRLFYFARRCQTPL